MSFRKLNKDNYQEKLDAIADEFREAHASGDNYEFRKLVDGLGGPVYRFVAFSCADVYSKDSGLVQFYESKDARDKDKLTIMKPGVFFRKVYPVATDREVEQFATGFKNMFAAREFDIVYSQDESDFTKAYTGKLISGACPNFSNPVFDVKSLNSSCMQGSRKNHDGKHPAIAYASGDFSILYAVEKDTACILARVVIGHRRGKSYAGPIYTDYNLATTALAEFMTALTVTAGDDGDWHGLTLQRIEVSEGVLCPYVDLASGVEDEGDSLSIGGDYEFSTCGVITVDDGRYPCEGCSDRIDDYEVCIDEDGHCYCEYCYSKRYIYSEHESLDIPIDDAVSDFEGHFASVYWFENNGYVKLESGEYAEKSDCVEYLSNWYHKSHEKVCEENGILFHADSIAYETKEVWQFGVGLNVNDGDRVPTPYFDLILTKSTELRHNYQLDETGTPVRLPELQF